MPEFPLGNLGNSRIPEYSGNFGHFLWNVGTFWGYLPLFLAFQAFIPACLGMYLGIYRNISGNYRQNA